MPPKKGLKKKKDLKQKRTIQSKLMQVSLKIDDYIYKKKVICVEEAKNVKQEIFSYRQMCRNDVRSLQVIDKLTRLLQKIIEEQALTTQTDTIETYNPDTVKDTLINDKDVTTFQTVSEITQDLNIINSSCSDFDLKKNLNDGLTSNTQDDNSQKKQSFERDNEIQTNSITVLNVDINDIRTEKCIDANINELPNVTVSDNQTNTNQCLNDNNQSQFGQDINNSQTSNSIKNYNLDGLQNNENNTQTICTKLDKERKTKDGFSTKDSNRNASIESTSSNNLGYNTRNKDDVDIKASILTRKRITTNNITPKKLNLSSTKKKSERSGLSWIENIKYVREINTDEYDPKLKELTESFWNNCIFPSDWDEDEFTIN